MVVRLRPAGDEHDLLGGAAQKRRHARTGLDHGGLARPPQRVAARRVAETLADEGEHLVRDLVHRSMTVAIVWNHITYSFQ